MILSKPAQKLGVFSLLMLAIVSVDSIRNLPMSAQYGTSLITFYLIAGLTFFAPLAMITSFLARQYSHTGGSYVWIQEAFGKRWALISIWLQWVYNVIWYPTIFAFISSTLASMIDPMFDNSTTFIFIISLVLFWIITLNGCYGVGAFSRLSAISAILGTLIPMALLIILAAIWLIKGHPSATPLTFKALIPSFDNWSNVTFFANILFSLLGIDVIAMHAGDVNNPNRTYPRVLFLAWIIIVSSLILSSLALCVVISPSKIGLLNGLMEAFTVFLNAYHFSWALYLMGGAIVLGGIGITSSWMVSLARGLHVASIDSPLPKAMQDLNRHAMPQNILLLQGVIFTILLSVFMLFPNINHSYWILSSMTAQFALLYYVLLFVAAFKLIQKHKKIGRYGIWIVLAIITSLIGVGVGFLPPSTVTGSHDILIYELTLCGGGLVFFLPLCFFLKK